MSKFKPLGELPDDKKAKLAALIKKFDLSPTSVVISKGPNTGHWVRKPDNSWVVLKDMHGRLIWPDGYDFNTTPPGLPDGDGQNPGKQNTPVKPAKRVCRFREGQRVTVKGVDHKYGFTIKQINDAGYGRTGFWAQLVYHGTELKYPRPVETADLEEFED